jgi:hypothetical protein
LITKLLSRRIPADDVRHSRATLPREPTFNWGRPTLGSDLLLNTLGLIVIGGTSLAAGVAGAH